MKQKKYEEIINLLRNGAVGMLKKGQVAEGSDLATLLIKFYNETKMSVSQQTLEPIFDIFSSFPDDGSNQREAFMKFAIQ